MNIRNIIQRTKIKAVERENKRYNKETSELESLKLKRAKQKRAEEVKTLRSEVKENGALNKLSESLSKAKKPKVKDGKQSLGNDYWGEGGNKNNWNL